MYPSGNLKGKSSLPFENVFFFLSFTIKIPSERGGIWQTFKQHPQKMAVVF
jgi:hypothetical protein